MRFANRLGIWVASLIAAGMLAMAPNIHAQRMDPLVPRPISSADLVRYADLLQLSADQRQAIEPLHDQYKAQWKALRKDANARAISAWEPLADIPFKKPPMNEVAAFLAAHDAALSGIAALDEQFFSEIEQILAREQKEHLFRMMRLRLRERSVSNFFVREWTNDRLAHAELRPLVARMDIPIEHAAAAAEILEAHESRFLTLLQKLMIESRQMRKEWTRLMEGTGFTEVKLGRPDIDMEAFNAMASAWDQATGAVKPIASELAVHNRKSFELIAALLLQEAAAKERRNFFIRHYDQQEDRSAENFAEAALSNKQLSTEQRHSISAAFEDYWKNYDRTLTEFMDVLDQDRAESRPNIGGSRFAERQMQIRQERFENNQNAHKAMTQALGPELVKEVGKRASAMATAQFKAIAGDYEESVSVAEYEEFLPRAISEADLQLYARLLKLNEAHAESMRGQHVSYRDQYKAARDAIVKQQYELRIAFMVRARSDEAVPRSSFASVDEVEKSNELTRSGVQQLLALDAELLSHIQSQLSTHHRDTLWRVQFARDCQRLLRGTRKGESTLRTYEAYVNPVEALMQADLSDDALDRAFATLKIREAELRSAASAHFEAVQRAKGLDDLTTAHRAGTKRLEAETIQNVEAERDEADTQATARRLDLIAMIRSTFQELYAAVPDHAAQLRGYYQQIAFPRVANDKTSAQAAIAAAVKLKNLTSQQRTHLEEIAAAYLPAYREVCEQMMQVCHEWDSHPRHEAAATRKRMTAKYLWEELEFERDELNITAANRLRRTLRSEQLSAIGLNAM